MSEMKYIVPTATMNERPEGYDLTFEIPGVAKGDVEQSELDTMLHDADVTLEELDPVSFAHENLTDLDETIRDAVK